MRRSNLATRSSDRASQKRLLSLHWPPVLSGGQRRRAPNRKAFESTTDRARRLAHTCGRPPQTRPACQTLHLDVSRRGFVPPEVPGTPAHEAILLRAAFTAAVWNFHVAHWLRLRPFSPQRSSTASASAKDLATSIAADFPRLACACVCRFVAARKPAPGHVRASVGVGTNGFRCRRRH